MTSLEKDTSLAPPNSRSLVKTQNFSYETIPLTSSLTSQQEVVTSLPPTEPGRLYFTAPLHHRSVFSRRSVEVSRVCGHHKKPLCQPPKHLDSDPTSIKNCTVFMRVEVGLCCLRRSLNKILESILNS